MTQEGTVQGQGFLGSCRHLPHPGLFQHESLKLL